MRDKLVARLNGCGYRGDIDFLYLPIDFRTEGKLCRARCSSCKADPDICHAIDCLGLHDFLAKAVAMVCMSLLARPILWFWHANLLQMQSFSFF